MMGSAVIHWAMDFAIVALCAALLMCAWRMARGPEALDRVLALDTMYVNFVALVILFGIRWNTSLLFEAALLLALLGFVSTVALSRYLSRGDVIE